jgi:ABC-type multidrug transport system fused ATPase/permease subunit
MDRLIVFDKGRIVEQGSHAKLIANSQLYAQLVKPSMINRLIHTGPSIIIK